MQSKKSVQIEKTWKEKLHHFFLSPEWELIAQNVRRAYQEKVVYPKPQNIFRAFELTPFNQVKVVILGQDPYHQPGQAHGLCFSVPDGVSPPPSLQNIYKEISSDLGIKKDFSQGNLENWAKQGVFLLNTILSVEKNKAGSHAIFGWEKFTDEVIRILSREKEGIVFMLWGNYARSKKKLIDDKKHLILEASHPSPLSAHRGFFGSHHFSQANTYLKKQGKEEIQW